MINTSKIVDSNTSSQVRNELVTLNSNIDELDKSIRELEARLDIILRSEERKDEPKATNILKPLVKLAEEIKTSKETIYDINDKVKSIISRLEI